MTLSVQPAIALFDTARGEACGVAPVGVADPTFFAPVTKVQREAGGVRGVAVNDAGQLVDAAGTVGGVPLEGEGVANVTVLTQAEYDATSPKVATTLYVISD